MNGPAAIQPTALPAQDGDEPAKADGGPLRAAAARADRPAPASDTTPSARRRWARAGTRSRPKRGGSMPATGPASPGSAPRPAPARCPPIPPPPPPLACRDPDPRRGPGASPPSTIATGNTDCPAWARTGRCARRCGRPAKRRPPAPGRRPSRDGRALHARPRGATRPRPPAAARHRVVPLCRGRVAGGAAALCRAWPTARRGRRHRGGHGPAARPKPRPLPGAGAGSVAARLGHTLRPVFRKITRWNTVEPQALGTDAVRRILIRRRP